MFTELLKGGTRDSFHSAEHASLKSLHQRAAPTHTRPDLGSADSMYTDVTKVSVGLDGKETCLNE